MATVTEPRKLPDPREVEAFLRLLVRILLRILGEKDEDAEGRPE